MKAVVCEKYLPLESLSLTDTERAEPKDGEVLVRVHATSVNFNTLVHITGRPLFTRAMTGLFKPKIRIPGSDISGCVEAVSPGVKLFGKGDEVMGELGGRGYGAYAEYVCVSENALAPKPGNLTHEETAAAPQAGIVALQALRAFGPTLAGKSVLVYGASGGIGTFAVQIARALGAEVTGVCGPKNLEMVRSLGADHVADYTREGFTLGSRRYDLIVATAGYRPVMDYVRALKPGGMHMVTGGAMRGRYAMRQILEAGIQGRGIERRTGLKVRVLTCKIKKEDLAFLKELMEEGWVKPVIDRSYPLERVGEALRYYAEGHARGKVVITIE